MFWAAFLTPVYVYVFLCVGVNAFAGYMCVCQCVSASSMAGFQTYSTMHLFLFYVGAWDLTKMFLFQEKRVPDLVITTGPS